MAASLVVNADDLGVSKGATLGIVRAHREGIVTSASLATAYPDYDHALDACARACPALGIGLHFTLTAGRPASPACDVPQLVGPDGHFRWRFTSLLRAASLARSAALLEQIDIELEAQIGRLRADGIAPDHVNGERHVHLIPGIFERVVAAASRHAIPFVRVGREIGTRFARFADGGGLLLRGGLAKSALLSSLSRRDRRLLPREVRSADGFASYLYSGRLDLVLKGLLAAPPPDGVTEVMVHPGIPEQSVDLKLGNRDLERYLASEDRRREMEACVAARRWTDGWRLVTFAQLARERTPT